MNARTRSLTIVLMTCVALVALVRGWADGTPLYSARAGRTCDNCHLTPNNWENPELAKRKCTLACQSCHYDPAGGGLRNASGRFYGRATLPLRASSPRPTADWDRRWGGLFPRFDPATTYTNDLPLGPNSEREVGEFKAKDLWAQGEPAGYSPYRLFQGRYGTINADPLFRFGWDLRVALLISDQALAFPMQGDYAVAAHPLEHLVLLANVGARGRTNGFTETKDDARTPYLREGYVLINELPYQGYIKAGRFLPSFGLRLDDHTSFIRRQFELDGALPESRVTGVEIGATSNYPFVNLSWFKSADRDVAPPAFNIFDPGEGSGIAVNAGYRNLGWSVGASVLTRRRLALLGGDATTFAVYGAFNPWYYKRGLPLTYQAEFDFGKADRSPGTEATKKAFYHELDWLAGNGLNVLLKHDWEDPDNEVKDDEAHRISGGVQITPIPGLTLDARLRYLIPAGGKSGADVFMQLHLWN